MGDINEVIPYHWNLGWKEVPGKPKVTLLLKAVIEKNIDEMERLASEGADLKTSDETTLQRVIFHVADNYPVMKWLVDHGFSRIGHDLDVNFDNGINSYKCISPNGYMWGVIARAYFLNAYDVMELLAQHGFRYYSFYDEGWPESREMDKEILRSGDPTCIRILLENGYNIGEYTRFEKRNYETYILNRPQVHRKSVGLDKEQFSNNVQTPKYEEVPLLFGRKEAKRRNERRKEDYEDRARARNEFIDFYGRDSFYELLRRRDQFEKETAGLMTDLVKELKL